jgi:hypothetical protein
MPLPVRTSAVPQKDEFYARLVERCITVVIDTLGSHDIRALLMIGAPARSEVTVVETPDGYYSLSDIDLVCACNYGTNRHAMREKLAPAVAELNRELDGVCAGADVSMKSEVQLAEPRPLISAYEMVRSPVVVWGDKRIVSALGDVDIADVPKSESLTLIHNRMTEELLVRPRGEAGPRPRIEALSRLYTTAKLTLDSITAYLFLRNNVPTGFAQRVDYFLEDVLNRPESAGLRDRLSGYLDELPAWALFKTTGDLSGVAEHLGGTLDDDGLADLAAKAWNRSIGYAEIFWRAILSDVVRRDGISPDLAGTARLYGRVEGLLRSVYRTRGMLKPGRAPDGLLSTFTAVTRAPFASPRVLAYLTAVVTYLSFSDAVGWERVEQLVRKYCPFNLPRGYGDLPPDERREALIDLIGLFHTYVLLGRKRT